jgi:hypothetical protein
LLPPPLDPPMKLEQHHTNALKEIVMLKQAVAKRR